MKMETLKTVNISKLLEPWYTTTHCFLTPIACYYHWRWELHTVPYSLQQNLRLGVEAAHISLKMCFSVTTLKLFRANLIWDQNCPGHSLSTVAPLSQACQGIKCAPDFCLTLITTQTQTARSPVNYDCRASSFTMMKRGFQFFTQHYAFCFCHAGDWAQGLLYIR